MRWSEPPPGACSHFTWLKQFQSQPRSLSAAVAQLILVRPMPATLALIILLAATPTPASVHVTVNDLVGTWNIIRGDSTGEHKLSGNGEYFVYRFPGAGGTGKWFLRDGNQIVIPSGSKKFPDEI